MSSSGSINSLFRKSYKTYSSNEEQFNNEEQKNNMKNDREKFDKLFKYSKIEINICGDFDWEKFKYIYGEEKEELKGGLDEIEIYGEKEEKNFKRYLDFIKTIKKYIRILKNRIKYRGKIYLELTKESEEQKKEIEDDNDIYNIKCVYSIENKKDFIFRDDNVLVEGINGKRQGFLFLMDELCNEDYEEDYNDD